MRDNFSKTRPLTLLDFSESDHTLAVDYTHGGNVVIDLEDDCQHLKLTLTTDTLLEILIAQLTMLQGGSYGE